MGCGAWECVCTLLRRDNELLELADTEAGAKVAAAWRSAARRKKMDLALRERFVLESGAVQQRLEEGLDGCIVVDLRLRCAAMLAVDGEGAQCLAGAAVRLKRSRSSLRCVSWAILRRLLSSNVRRPTKAGAAPPWLAG